MRKLKMNFAIKGKVLDFASNPIPNVFVEAYDSDVGSDDFLGIAKTDISGTFELFFSEDVFKEIFERNPDVYFIVRDGLRILHKSDVKSEIKNGETINIVISDKNLFTDLYANSAERTLSQFLSMGDSVDFSKGNFQNLTRQMINAMLSWIYYTNPQVMKKYGHAGPQVPRYPKREPNHIHSLPWNNE